MESGPSADPKCAGSEPCRGRAAFDGCLGATDRPARNRPAFRIVPRRFGGVDGAAHQPAGYRIAALCRGLLER